MVNKRIHISHTTFSLPKSYKPEYIYLAREVQRRVINTQVTFHAVSCTLNENICYTYEIDGYPTIYGWRGGTGAIRSNGDGDDDNGNGIPYKYPDITDFGILLNPDWDSGITAESIAHQMNFEIAEEGISSPKGGSGDGSYSWSNSQDKREYEENQITAGIEAAKLKRSTFAFYGSMNELYHDAAVSLAFVLKTSIYTTNTAHHDRGHKYGSVGARRNSLDGDRAMALHDFLSLMDWATPSWWSVRRGLIKDLLMAFDHGWLAAGGKEGLSKILEPYQVSLTVPRLKDGKSGNNNNKLRYDDENLIWGYILRSGSGVRLKNRSKKVRRKSLGGDPPEFYQLSRDEIIDKNMRWTQGCTHNNTNSGYTCGLWHIFHILTIGASQPENQLYGFHRGYDVSPREVAKTMRNFVAYFFGCDVCKHNFLNMYDTCGHDHCTRLITDVMNLDEEFASKEVALWLFEVHNAVNVRLMRESAEREERVLTKAEELASKFPSREICPKCWLDDGMEKWNREVVFDFLKDWYWPTINEGELNALSMEEGYSLQSYHPLSLAWLCLVGLSLLSYYTKRKWTIIKASKSDKIK